MDLKPCPRCQNEAALHDYHGEIAPICWKCRLSGPYFQTPDEAIEWWNTRAADLLLKEMAEALEKLSRLGNEPYLGSSIGNLIAQEALKKYHDQIGEPK